MYAEYVKLDKLIPLPPFSKQSGLSPSENQVGEVRKQQLVSHLGTSLYLVRTSKGMPSDSP